MVAIGEFPGCTNSFLSRIILFLCFDNNHSLMGGVMIRDLGGLVGMME